MATVTKIGPAEHGRPMMVEEFEAEDFEEGYKYELINGRLYVTYEPDPPEDWIEKWLFTALLVYSWKRPKVINYVTDKARVYVPDPSADTIPEPDLAAYHDYPVHLALGRIRWRNVSPVLVAEVMSGNDPHKDLIRNVQLYLQVPSIKEYWIVDGRDDPEHPRMRVHRRQGKRWQVIDLSYKDTYASKLLPGFKLVIDPRS